MANDLAPLCVSHFTSIHFHLAHSFQPDWPSCCSGGTSSYYDSMAYMLAEPFVGTPFPQIPHSSLLHIIQSSYQMPLSQRGMPGPAYNLSSVLILLPAILFSFSELIVGNSLPLYYQCPPLECKLCEDKDFVYASKFWDTLLCSKREIIEQYIKIISSRCKRH